MLLAFTTASMAQDNQLKFSRAVKVSDTQMTIPAGKVWKVTAVTGQEFRPSTCVDMSPGSSHEIGELLQCAYPGATRSVNTPYSISSLVIDGQTIPFRISGLATSAYVYYQQTTCSGNGTSNRDLSCANMNSDPNTLPLWLAEGTTIKTGGPNTIASVLEFNVVPE